MNPKKITSSGTVFVKENTGNIKDFYKISSCIGRGKSTYLLLQTQFQDQINIFIHLSMRPIWLFILRIYSIQPEIYKH